MKKKPVRTCVSCGCKFPQDQMQRYSWMGDSPVMDGENERAEGRGAYSCKNEQCRKKFYTDRKRWKRAFRLS